MKGYVLETLIKSQWESAAPGWAKWEYKIADWMKPATELMLGMAGVVRGSRVLDIACGAGSQTLEAARKIGDEGHIVAYDISETMLNHVQQNVQTARLNNVTIKSGAAEDIDTIEEKFDAVICRLGLMLFAEPTKALTSVRRVLKPGGSMAVVVFTIPEKNQFMAKTMQVLLRHAGKKTPAPGQPGIFSLGAPGVLKELFTGCGFVEFSEQTLPTLMRMPSIDQTLEMMKEAFGAYRAVISDCPESVQKSAWAEVEETLKEFQISEGFEAHSEVCIGAAVN